MLAANDGSIALLIVTIFLIVLVFGFLFQGSRSQSIIEKWASENDYELLEANRTFLTMAFAFRRSKDQTVYRIRIRDRHGRERSGYLRCGGYWGGVTFSDKATVKWDD